MSNVSQCGKHLIIMSHMMFLRFACLWPRAKCEDYTKALDVKRDIEKILSDQAS